MLFQNVVDDLGGAFLVSVQFMTVHTVRVKVLTVSYNGFQHGGWQGGSHHGHKCVTQFVDGTVIVETFDRIEQPTYNNEPPMYELRRDEIVYGFTEHGRFVIKQVNRFSYFSETDIYRFSIYFPDDEGELYSDSDKWIYPEDLEKYGFEPFDEIN